MRECDHRHSELVELLREEISPGDRRRLVRRVEECEACAAEFRVLAETWERLPVQSASRPPAGVRRRVLARAGGAVGQPPAVAEPAGNAGPVGVAHDLWRAVRPAVLPATAGVVAAGAIVALLHFGGGLAVRGHIPVLAFGLVLAALLSGAAGGLWANASRRASGAVLLGGLAALGAYLVLSLLHPIPRAVEFCQLRIFRDPGMSLGQVCLVYAGVAALYAGVPVGVTAYLSSTTGDGWRIGLAEAAVFTLFALPVLGLQFGLEEVAITGTVLAGAALGAAVGGVAGSVARKKRARHAPIT